MFWDDGDRVVEEAFQFKVTRRMLAMLEQSRQRQAMSLRLRFLQNSIHPGTQPPLDRHVLLDPQELVCFPEADSFPDTNNDKLRAIHQEVVAFDNDVAMDIMAFRGKIEKVQKHLDRSNIALWQARWDMMEAQYHYDEWVEWKALLAAQMQQLHLDRIDHKDDDFDVHDDDIHKVNVTTTHVRLTEWVHRILACAQHHSSFHVPLRDHDDDDDDETHEDNDRFNDKHYMDNIQDEHYEKDRKKDQRHFYRRWQQTQQNLVRAKREYDACAHRFRLVQVEAEEMRMFKAKLTDQFWSIVQHNEVEKQQLVAHLFQELEQMPHDTSKSS